MSREGAVRGEQLRRDGGEGSVRGSLCSGAGRAIDETKTGEIVHKWATRALCSLPSLQVGVGISTASTDPFVLLTGTAGWAGVGKGVGGRGRSPHQTCHHYLPFQTRINSVIIIWVFRDTLEGTPVICVFPDTHELVFITCVFPDTHELCHLYRCLPRHARSVSSLSVSSQTHMKGAPS